MKVYGLLDCKDRNRQNDMTGASVLTSHDMTKRVFGSFLICGFVVRIWHKIHFLMAQLKSFQTLVLADKRKQWSKQFHWNPPNIGQKMPALLERPKMTKTMYQALKRHIMRERERKKQGNNLNLLSERWFCVFGQASLSKQCRLIDWGCCLIKVYTVCLLSCFFWRHYCIRIQLCVHCSNFMIITAIFWLSKFFELRYSDLSCLVKKPTKWHVHPAKTQISLGIHPVWSESSLSAWRKLWSLASHWAHSKDSDQTGRMPRLIWGFAGRVCHFVGFVTKHLTCLLFLLHQKRKGAPWEEDYVVHNRQWKQLYKPAKLAFNLKIQY